MAGTTDITDPQRSGKLAPDKKTLAVEPFRRGEDNE
jgi:hypothetical protein